MGCAHWVGREDRKRERAATRIHDYRPCTRAQSVRCSARDTCFWSSCVGSEDLSAFSRPSFPLYFLQMSSLPTPPPPPPCSYCCLIIVSHLFCISPGLSEKQSFFVRSCRRTGCLTLSDSSMQMPHRHTRLIAKSLFTVNVG